MLSRIPHVVRMIPIVGGRVVATLGNRPEEASVSSGAGEDPEFRKRIVVGRSFDSDDERSVLLSEMFAHRIGLIDDADLDQVSASPCGSRSEARKMGRASMSRCPAGRKPAAAGTSRRRSDQLAWQIPGRSTDSA